MEKKLLSDFSTFIERFVKALKDLKQVVIKQM